MALPAVAAMSAANASATARNTVQQPASSPEAEPKASGAAIRRPFDPKRADRFTRQQQLAALFLASGYSVQAVANLVGRNRSTIWRWTEMPEFKAVVLDHKNALDEHLRKRIVASYLGALEALEVARLEGRLTVQDQLRLLAALDGQVGRVVSHELEGQPEAKGQSGRLGSVFRLFKS